MVQGFGGELRQLFSNLISNAVDALEENGRLRVRVTHFRSGSNGRLPGVRVTIADNGSGGYYDYRISKTVLNMVARGVSRDLADRGVIALALHPGWVQTRMGGAAAKVTIADCVAGQQQIFAQATAKESGRRKDLPW